MNDQLIHEMVFIISVVVISIGAMLLVAYAIPTTPAPAPEANVSVVAFTAKWCKTCNKIRPILIAIKASGVSVDIINIDTHEGMVLARKYGVTSVPTFFVQTKSGMTRTQNIFIVVRIIEKNKVGNDD